MGFLIFFVAINLNEIYWFTDADIYWYWWSFVFVKNFFVDAQNSH